MPVVQSGMEPDTREAEHRFFAALQDGDVDRLEQLLAEDFLVVDVLSGSEVARPALLAALSSGDLVFEAIDLLDSRERRYGATAIVNGRTRIRGRFRAQPFAAHSRYTHVYVREDGRWRLATAQGTPVVVPD